MTFLHELMFNLFSLFLALRPSFVVLMVIKVAPSTECTVELNNQAVLKQVSLNAEPS